MEDVIQLVLPIHPNIPAGQVSYNAQITLWNVNNLRQNVNEFQPHPLSPGTNPITSGECWRCGMLGHMGNNCDNPVQMPMLEQHWRSIAATIKHNCPTPMTNNVSYVGDNLQWITKEEYDQRIIENFLANQGKGQGSSA
jgi:hypothetical protein